MEFDLLKLKFYGYSNAFNKYKNINQEQIRKIRNEVNILLEELNTYLKIHSIFEKKLYIYQKVLEYLSNPIISMKYPTFDERILFLILATDPNCDTYRTYIANITKNSSSDEKYKIINTIRKQLGFYDKNLLPFEKYYLLKYNIITDIKIDYTNLIILSANTLVSFEHITDEQYKLLTEKRALWDTLAGKTLSNKTYAYNIFYSELSVHEKIILLIVCIDPELQLLQIYEDESRMNRLIERCQAEFGFYSKGIFRLEELYRQKFGKHIKIDTWDVKQPKILNKENK